MYDVKVMQGARKNKQFDESRLNLIVDRSEYRASNNSLSVSHTESDLIDRLCSTLGHLIFLLHLLIDAEHEGVERVNLIVIGVASDGRSCRSLGVPLVLITIVVEVPLHLLRPLPSRMHVPDVSYSTHDQSGFAKADICTKTK